MLIVSTRYISSKLMRASNAFVGLALPGPVGSWQTETKVIFFWILSSIYATISIRSYII